MSPITLQRLPDVLPLGNPDLETAHDSGNGKLGRSAVADSTSASSPWDEVRYGTGNGFCRPPDIQREERPLSSLIEVQRQQGTTMTIYSHGTEVVRTRHIHAISIMGGLLLWLGVTLSLTVVGMIIGIPMAIAGLGILTTPHPH